MKVEWECTQDSKVDLSESAWILYSGSSHNRDTKYYKIVEIYWHMKMVMGQAPVAKEQGHI